MNPMHSQRGVAMVTVLLIGAALTAVTSVGAFATIREFGAGDDDRDAANALAVAEAGIDRFLSYLKSGQVTYGLMNQAGCDPNPPLSLPDGAVGPGTFSVNLTVYNPLASGAAQFPPGACTGRPTNPNKGQTGFETSKSSFFVIRSEGRVPEATRVLRQVIAMQPIGLPVGIYARSITVQSAQHDFLTVSMVAETTIQKRANLNFQGDDPWYLLGDVFPGGVSGRGSDWATQAVPAAAHAAGTIYLGNSSPTEFPPTKNCTANQGSEPAPDGPSKSLWDSDGSPGSGTITSGCTGQTGWPNSSKFTTEQLAAFASPRLSEQDYQTLKDAAKSTGLYCSFPGSGGTGGTTCIKRGTDTGADDDYAGHIANLGAAPPGGAGLNNLLTYFEFRSGTATQNNLGKTGSWWGCNDDPDLSRSIVVIVRNGGVDYTGAAGDQINGAFVIDGNWTSNGSFTFNGSLIAQGNIHFQSSAQNYQLDSCWVKNTPGPFLRVVPDAWTEVDR